VLCAGCSRQEREWAEAAVRRVVGKGVDGGPWTISLVKVGAQWSVTVDAPGSGIRTVTLIAPGNRLGEAIAEAIAAPGRPAGPGPVSGPGSGPPSERRGRFDCHGCGRPFLVVYQAAPNENERSAPAACPHCWHVNHVLIGENAAETREYQAEKA